MVLDVFKLVVRQVAKDKTRSNPRCKTDLESFLCCWHSTTTPAKHRIIALESTLLEAAAVLSVTNTVLTYAIAFVTRRLQHRLENSTECQLALPENKTEWYNVMHLRDLLPYPIWKIELSASC